MLKRILMSAAAVMLLSALAACGDGKEATANIHAISAAGVGDMIVTVRAHDGAEGLVMEIEIAGLAPGPHGLHVHENGDCGPGLKDGQTVAGLAAGGHYDPQATGVHEGPKGAGHLGDLPVLIADGSGMAAAVIVAPRLSVADIRGRALVIHEGGDNFSDSPAPLGGGGARIACGVVN